MLIRESKIKRSSLAVCITDSQGHLYYECLFTCPVMKLQEEINTMDNFFQPFFAGWNWTKEASTPKTVKEAHHGPQQADLLTSPSGVALIDSSAQIMSDSAFKVGGSHKTCKSGVGSSNVFWLSKSACKGIVTQTRDPDKTQEK